jgi:hypothetical protein
MSRADAGARGLGFPGGWRLAPMSTLVQVDYGRTGSVDGDYIGGEVTI